MLIGRNQYLRDQSITRFGNGFNYPGVFAGIFERLAQLCDGSAQCVIADNSLSPDFIFYFPSGNHLVWARREVKQQFQAPGFQFLLDSIARNPM